MEVISSLKLGESVVKIHSDMHHSGKKGVGASKSKKEYISYALSEGKTKHAAREETATNEHEQNVLARIRTRRKQGTLYPRIAAALDAAGTLHKEAANGLQ